MIIDHVLNLDRRLNTFFPSSHTQKKKKNTREDSFGMLCDMLQYELFRCHAL